MQLEYLLIMGLTLQPNGRSIVGREPTSYRVDLPNSAMAILDWVRETGWQLSVRERGQVFDRGVFATPNEILELLESEFLPRSGDGRDLKE